MRLLDILRRRRDTAPYQREAATGAQLLDQTFHSHNSRERLRWGYNDIDAPWWSALRIDLADLDMGDPSRCILGQLYGSYHVSPTDYRIDGNRIASCDYGFNLHWNGDDRDPAWRQLGDAWKTEIMRRRDQAAATAGDVVAVVGP